MKTYIALLALLLTANVIADEQPNVYERSADALFNTAKNTAIIKINRELYNVNPQAPGIAWTAFDDITEGTNKLETSPNIVDLIYTTVYDIFD